MTAVRSYRELDGWNVGMEVVEKTYVVTRLLPEYEKYELSAQMRKAAVSIPSNVAEGYARGTVPSCLYFLRIAVGSAAELDTHLEAARRLRFVTIDQAKDLQSVIDRVRQILYGMRREKLRKLIPPVIGVIAFLLSLSSHLAS